MVYRKNVLIITLVTALSGGFVYSVETNMSQDQLREKVVALIDIKPGPYGFTQDQLGQIESIKNEIKKLITADANINAPDAQGVALLRMAARNNSLPAVQFLLSNGANVNYSDPKGITALHSAVVNKAAPEIASALLDAGAGINTKNNDGMTPLLLAVQKWNEPVVRLLVSRGADKTITSPKGRTAMQMARDISMKPEMRGLETDVMFGLLSEKPLP